MEDTVKLVCAIALVWVSAMMGKAILQFKIQKRLLRAAELLLLISYHENVSEHISQNCIECAKEIEEILDL